MDTVEFYLEVDVGTLKISDLKKGITLLGGVIPQGSVLKKNLIDILQSAKDQYMINKSAGNATFNSPQKLSQTFGSQDPEVPPVVELYQAPKQAQQQDLTLNAFQITGQNLLGNEIIKSKLKQEYKDISSEIKPTRALKPPKGIERTPQMEVSKKQQEEKVDLETFVQANQSKQSIQQSQYNRNSSVHGSNFDFTTNFTNADLGKTGNTTISEEYRKTQQAIEDIHKDIRSVLDIASPVRIVKSVHEPSQTQSPDKPVKKPKKNPKKKINKGPPKYIQAPEQNVASCLKESDLNFSLQARNQHDALFSPEQTKSVKVSQLPFKSFVFTSKYNIYILINSTFFLLILSTVIINYLNNEAVIKVPILTGLLTRIFAFVLPRNKIDSSHSLTSTQPTNCPQFAICNEYNEFISCQNEYLKIKEFQSSKYTDLQFKFNNYFYNIRQNLLHSLGSDNFPVETYSLFKCIYNSEDSVIINEAFIRSKSKISKLIKTSYSKSLSAYKLELDCIINSKCTHKHKPISYTQFLFSVEDVFPNIKEKIYYLYSQKQLPSDLELVEINDSLFISVSAEQVYPNFSYLHSKFINFIIHPLKSLFFISIKLAIFGVAFFFLFKFFLYIYEKRILEKSVSFLLHLKKNHKTGDNTTYSIKSGQLMSQVFKTTMVPDFIIEMIWNDVEKMLLVNKNVECNYSRNVFGEVETAFYYGNYVDGVEWSGVKGVLNDDEESTHTIEY
ncbi:Transmembrane domain-containing protein [Spironucleus salmonicida]|uniref:Transmembrane domain-containing protein n=1 Tax=Spironucleus salmonicida TaxID=348837 RepID=V6LDH5_9EUKA|nr:Transmembrane domain-containing protein [Spironucleus salmonicida]|eukprot:EST41716.1 Transmembrane domain-containing protein [Spironucleus salmonicida]